MKTVGERTQALFGRAYTLRIARVIAALPREFSNGDVLRDLGLGDSRRVTSLVQRELRSLVEAEVVRHLRHGRWYRIDDEFWRAARLLLDAWERAEAKARPRGLPSIGDSPPSAAG